MTERATPVWMVRAGKYGQDEAVALEQGLAIIGFSDIPDLSGVSPEEMVEIVRRATPDDRESRIQNRAAQLTAFVHRMREGDNVALPRKAVRQVALGYVVGPYDYREVNGVKRHTRRVNWKRPDVPRGDFQQDLLYSLGAFMTVCRIKRNDAESRIAAVLGGSKDPGPKLDAGETSPEATEASFTAEEAAPSDIAQIAHDQVLGFIEARFAGHDLARLVDAVLQAEGYAARLSPPGPDGGVDILAGKGPLGLDTPRLCVQVKSSTSPVDVTVFRALQGSMGTFGADQGLLVCWGGFTRSLLHEARQSFFNVRLWDAGDLVEAIYRTYDRLPEEIQAELPLKRVWTLVREEDEA